MTLTARQRIDAMLKADFYGDDRGTVATRARVRREIIDALPSGPCLDRYIPKPVSLPPLPDRLIAN